MTIYRYNSTDIDAPVLSGSAGSLIALLDACLVNGYSAGPTAKAPAGWAKTHAGTNKAIYRAPTGLRRFFRVNDTGAVSGNGATRAHIRGCEAVTDIDTNTDMFPSSALPSTEGMIVAKSNVASAAVRPWTIVADEAGCYLFIEANPNYGGLCYATYFGDFVSYGDTDPYGACIVGDTTDWGPTLDPRVSGNSRFSALYMACVDVTQSICCNAVINRSHTGTAGHQRAALIGPASPHPGHQGGGSSIVGRAYQQYAMGWMIGGLVGYPDPVGGLILDTPKLVYGSQLRGYLPGVYLPLSNHPLAHKTEISNFRALPGRTALALDLPATRHGGVATVSSITDEVGAGQCLVDLTGPWR